MVLLHDPLAGQPQVRDPIVTADLPLPERIRCRVLRFRLARQQVQKGIFVDITNAVRGVVAKMPDKDDYVKLEDGRSFHLSQIAGFSTGGYH